MANRRIIGHALAGAIELSLGNCRIRARFMVNGIVLFIALTDAIGWSVMALIVSAPIALIAWHELKD